MVLLQGFARSRASCDLLGKPPADMQQRDSEVTSKFTVLLGGIHSAFTQEGLDPGLNFYSP